MLKRIAEALLLAAGVARRGIREHAGRTLILAYHNVVPDGERPTGDRSLHLPQRAFGEQLDALTSTHDIVPLLSLGAASASARPRAIITFDDAYRGALTAGAEELSRRRLPWTMFVAPGLLGDQSTWWDAFADPDSGELDAEFRIRCLTTCWGSAVEVRALTARESRAEQSLPAWARTAHEEELAAAVATGMTVGSHSWSHANLAVLEGAALEHEIAAPIGWLAARFPAALVPYLAYPYGLSSPGAEAAALRGGCRGALRVEGGYLAEGRGDPPTRLPRLNVPSGVSRAGFALRVAGALVR